MSILKELTLRGFIATTSNIDELEYAFKAPLSFYCGFDPTADSLHLGNLMPIILMRHLQNAGHSPIILVGGATGMIGDPSGKSVERTLLSSQNVLNNAESIKAQLQKYLSFNGDNQASLVNNADWFCELSLLDFLRDIGKHVSVNQMLLKDSVKERYKNDQGISFTEFTYQLLQAYDFVHLSSHSNCQLQIGGSDQWGNITAGIQLTRKMLAKSVHGITHPLLQTADGKKFGKSEGNAIWLDKQKTSPYELYQYLLNVSDEDVKKLLLLLTFNSISDIDEICNQHILNPENRVAQKRLAYDLVCFVHSTEDAVTSVNLSEAFFSEKYESLGKEEIKELCKGFSSAAISFESFKKGVSLSEVLVNSSLMTSKSQASKLVEAGGIYINGRKVTDSNYCMTENDILANDHIVLRRGKKSFLLIEVV